MTKNPARTSQTLNSDSQARRLTRRTLSAELDLGFSLDQIKAEVSCWRRLLDTFCGGTESEPKLDHFERICGLCLMCPKDPRLQRQMRTGGLARLDQFLSVLTRREAILLDTKRLTWCLLNLVAFFSIKQRDNVGWCARMQRHKVDVAKDLFHSAMDMVLPEKQTEVIKYSVTYFRLTLQWYLEDFVAFVFNELLSLVNKPEMVLGKLIKQIEISKRAGCHEEAQNITSGMAAILERTIWERYLLNHRLHNCFNALLKLYLIHDFSVASSRVANVRFRSEIKMCIKNFISNIKDNKGLVSVMDSLAKCLRDSTISVEDRLELCDLIVFSSQHHETKLYRETLTPDLFDFIVTNLLSNRKGLIIVGHRILHHLLDRHGNLKSFTEPVYYFRGRVNFLVNTDCDAEDVAFIKSSSQLFEGVSLSLGRYNERSTLVMCYTTICLVLVEIPEPVVTINIIHIVVTTQNEILKARKEYSMAAFAHVHAIIASVLSLICVVHLEEVEPLRRYVQEVLQSRAENAPHLLPPLSVTYSLASHHVTEYHDQLYFVEEEVLYALQRCWLGKRGSTPSKSKSSLKRVEFHSSGGAEN